MSDDRTRALEVASDVCPDTGMSDADRQYWVDRIADAILAAERRGRVDCDECGVERRKSEAFASGQLSLLRAAHRDTAAALEHAKAELGALRSDDARTEETPE